MRVAIYTISQFRAWARSAMRVILTSRRPRMFIRFRGQFIGVNCSLDYCALGRSFDEVNLHFAWRCYSPSREVQSDGRASPIYCRQDDDMASASILAAD